MFFWPIRLAIRILTTILFAAFVYLVFSAVQVVTASRLPTAVSSVKRASAIVLLSGPVVGTSPSADLLGRLEETLQLYDARLAPTVVVTGAPPAPGALAAVTVERTWLLASKVPASAIVSSTAPSAAEELPYAASVLGSSRSDVIVVTDAIDASWTRGTASAAGFHAQLAPAVGSEKFVLSELGPLWDEASGLAVGRVIGYGRASWAAG